MRIISKFHDYYDTAMAYGHDATTIYVRNFEIVTDKRIAEQFAPLYGMGPVWGRGVEKQNNKWSAVIRPFAVAFCGLTYKGVWVRAGGYNPVTEIDVKSDECFYNYDAFATHLKKFGFELAVETEYRHWTNSRILSGSESVRWQKFLGSQGSNEFESMLIENKIVSMFYSPSNTFDELLQGKWRHIPNNDPYVVMNPPLKPLGFYKVFDAFSTFQELEMYIGGVLPKPGAMTVEIEDKYRIPQHGFDKWSFRKQGEKNG